MPAFTRVAAVGDVPPGTGKCIEAGGKQIALFNVGGTFHAMDNTCLYRGGPLGDRRGACSDLRLRRIAPI